MLALRNLRTLAGAVIATSLLGAAGCGGLGPGDYVTYRVAFDDTRPAASCYPGDEIPTSIKDDKTTFRNGSTFLIYIASDEEALLDTGDVVLNGSIDGDSYSFSGKVTDVEYPPGQTILDSDHDGIEDFQDPLVDADNDGLDDQNTDPMVDVDNDGLDDRGQDTIVDANNDGEDDRYVEIPSGIKFIDTLSLTIDMTVDGSAVTGTSKSKTAQSCEGATCPLEYDVSCTRTTDFKGVEIEETEPDFGSSDGSASP